MTHTRRVSILSSLYRCEQYLDGFFDAVTAVSDSDIELLLLHNDPTERELAIISERLPGCKVHVRHIIIPEREGLYRTWNRGIAESGGEYLAVWNVDDVRTPDSLRIQAAALDAHPGAVLCYGSYIGLQQYGDREGIHYSFPEFNQQRFLRTCYLTPFPMWRRSVHETAGLFDESFRSAGDYDFQIRAARCAPFVRVPQVCGYYLEAPQSGISKTGDINNIERTVCELRYGILDKVNWFYLRSALRYSLLTVRWNGEQLSLTTFFHRWDRYVISRIPLAPLSIFRLPINLLREVKHNILPRLRSALSAYTPQSRRSRSLHQL